MIVKRSLSIRGHRTSISMEDVFWDRLRAIATENRLSLAGLVAQVDEGRGESENLSSAIRVFVLCEALEHIAAPARSLDTAPPASSI